MITKYFTYILYSFLCTFAKNGLFQSTDRVEHAFVRCFEGRVYSTLEGEALAIAWSLKKSRLFLLSCTNFTFVIDHKTLTRIFRDKELKDIANTRLLNLKE